MPVRTLHAVSLVERRAGGADLLTEHPSQRHRESLEHRDGRAERARRGGDLRADETTTDHDKPRVAADQQTPAAASRRASVASSRCRSVALLEGSGDANRWRSTALSNSSRDPSSSSIECPSDVERHHTVPETQVEPELLDLVRREKRDPGFVPLSGEELLRERRPVVRGMRLLADDDDRAGEALIAKSRRRSHPGERRADYRRPSPKSASGAGLRSRTS